MSKKIQTERESNDPRIKVPGSEIEYPKRIKDVSICNLAENDR